VSEPSVADLQAVIASLLGLAAGLTVVIWKLFNKMARGCPRCPHCIEEHREEDERKKKKRIEDARTNLRHLGVSEEEINRRLDKWPKAVVAPEARPSRGSLGDAGRSERLR